MPQCPARLLICDDQRLNRLYVQTVLKAVTWVQVVGEAETGHLAVAKALELKPDLILMDISMPELDGIQATKRILAQNAGVRILGFSVEANAKTVKEMLAAGAQGFLVKNGDPFELIAALRKLVAGERYFTTQRDASRSWPRPD